MINRVSLCHLFSFFFRLTTHLPFRLSQQKNPQEETLQKLTTSRLSQFADGEQVPMGFSFPHESLPFFDITLFLPR